MPVFAQVDAAAGAPGIKLKQGTSLLQQVPIEVRKELPVFGWGENIEGEMDAVSVFEGGAELRRHDTVIKADRIEHDKRTGDTKANGNVLLNRKVRVAAACGSDRDAVCGVRWGGAWLAPKSVVGRGRPLPQLCNGV